VLASSLSLLGPIVLCLVVYLRWQLGEAGENDAAIGIFSGAVSAPKVAANACRYLPSPAGSVVVRACAAGLARRDEQTEPEWWRAPGVYVGSRCSAVDPNADATSRGELLAERIIHGCSEANEAPRRGKKGALDVIVVGANLLGISATVRLMQAGLRVLLVDRQSWAPLDSSPYRLVTSPGVARRMRLPLVTGHHVSVVAQRADGMLELQAERAAWYTANVIFASREVAAPIGERTNAFGTPLVACTPAAPRAA
jgi:hypothetical protein